MAQNKIVLINPDIVGEKEIFDYPIGLAYLSAAIKKYGFDVEIYDMYYNEDEDTVLRKIFDIKPLIIGITCTTPIFDEILLFACKIKRISPKSKIILGGHHVSSIAELILEKYKQIDGIVLYEGETTICKLATTLISEQQNAVVGISGIAFRLSNNELYINEKHDKINLNDYPIPDWEAIITPDEMYKRGYYQRRQASIVTMRGCWGKCSFCDSQCISKINYKSIDSVEKEIEFLIEHYSIEYLYVQDLDFLKNKKRALEISKIINAKDIKGFQIVTRADSFLKAVDVLESIRLYGCDFIEIGIESGSSSQLKRFNKMTDINTNSQAINILKNIKLNYSLSFIMFDPFVTLAEIKDNYQFFIDNRLNNNENEKWLFSILDIFPGTDIEKEARISSLIGSDSHNRNSLFYNFINEDISLFYSFVYSYSKEIYPIIIQIRMDISNLFKENENSINEMQFQLRNIYISINILSFKYFYALLSETPDNYYKVFQEFRKKSLDANKSLTNLRKRYEK